MKKDDRKFFNVIYAKTVGNQGGDDGFKYRGRGFNQLTGIKNYEKYGQLIGMGNNPMVGATVAVAVAVEESMK